MQSGGRPPGRPPIVSIERTVTVDDPRSRLTGHETVQAVQHGLRMAPGRSHDAGAQLRSLPDIVVVRLRDGDVEPIVEAVFQALDHAPLLLQRLAAVDLQIPGDEADDHRSCDPPVRRGARDSGAFTAALRSRQCSGHLFDAEALDQVADLHVVEALNVEAALEALAHLAHVVLEALEAGELALVDLHAVADQANTSPPVDDALGHVATGDRPHARNLEELPDLGDPEQHLALLG